MVKSIINPEKIDYKENKDIELDDIDYEATIYDYNLFGIPIEIALGREQHTYSRYNIVYFSIYLIINDEPKSKIAVFEIDSNQLIQSIDNDGDIDLLKGNIIPFITKEYLQQLINKNTAINKKNNELNQIDELEKKQMDKVVYDLTDNDADEPVADDIDVMKLKIPETYKVSEANTEADTILKEGIFIINQNTKPPEMLPEENEKDNKTEFKESSRNKWINNFMKNMDYNIIDNEGGGDCFFAVIRDAFKQIGKETTINKLRALLSKEATEDLYSNNRLLYVNYLAEIQDIEKEMKAIKKTSLDLKKRSELTTNKMEDKILLEEANKMIIAYKKLVSNKKETKELMKEFEYMKDVDNLEKFREKILTSEYWADTWAVSTLERLLNIKMIVLSKESYSAGELDSVLTCGQLNDSDLERQGQFIPDYYIMTAYTGQHFTLITYKNKGIFKFREVPYDIKVLIINKCMEKNSGPYYLIQDFRNLKTKIGLDANEGEPSEDEDEYLNKDLYEKDVVLSFHANANSSPKAGKGNGEKIPGSRMMEFNDLNIIPEWRKKLDDSWSAPFTVDGHRWNTVEHYLLGSQFKKGFPDFYLQFSVDSGSDISEDLVLARIAGGKTGKTKDRVLRDKKILVDNDFYEIGPNPRNIEERKIALNAKFTQNLDLKQVLLETKMAKLNHFIRGREPEKDELLMKLRKDLR